MGRSVQVARPEQPGPGNGQVPDDPSLRDEVPPPDPPPEIDVDVEQLRYVKHEDVTAAERQQSEVELIRKAAIDGASFILDAPSEVPSVWGEDERVAWSEGEALMIVGPQGAGKTTIAQQLTLARAGITSELLGMPVVPDARRVLYIAADRPRQAQRSFARMVSGEHRDALADRLIVWKGPLPFDLASEPERLAAMAVHFEAGTLVIDSLKDVALDLSKDETGSRVNLAVQHCLAADVQTALLHHQRKASAGNAKPKALADVYGSTWVTAGCGSVLLVWGDAGDAVVELSHLKQPAADVGPFRILHDHQAGRSTVLDPVDLLALARASTNGITASEAARSMYDAISPDRNQIEKARRRLDQLVRKDLLHRKEGTSGGTGGGTPTRWHPVTLLEAPL